MTTAIETAPQDPRLHGFLPPRTPVRTMIGTWVRLDALAAEAATAADRGAARDLVERAARNGDLAALRVRVSRLSPRNAEAAGMRVAVIAAACGWAHLDPDAPASARGADAAFLDLWAAVAHRLDRPHFVALPTLALLNWGPARKPRRQIPIDQLARTEELVPVVRWSGEGQRLSRLDHLMLAATRLEAHGIWLFRLADTLAEDGPQAATATALRRLTRIQHTLRAQLHAEQSTLELAPSTPQQRAVLTALAADGQGSAGGRSGTGLPGPLEPPVLQAAEAVLGMGARRLGEGGRQLVRRHLPAPHRAWLTAMDRHCAPVRTLAHRGGTASLAYREAQESLIALRHAYAGLLRTAAEPQVPAARMDAAA
ncbi:hypothetical protein [Streptomyces varsoviensis]|nr:hypothetical protein [Streptomyces varsoviensis]